MLNNVLFKIAIPTILFTFITFLPKFYLRGQGFSMQEMLKSALLGNQYWFTCALVVAELLLFAAIANRWKSVWAYALIGLTLAVVSQIIIAHDIQFWGNPSMPWYYKSGLTATAFLTAGGVYWKYEQQIDRYVPTVVLGIVTLIACYVLLFHSDWGQSTITRGNLNVIGFITAIVMSYAVIRVCKVLPPDKVTTYVGRHSIGFYFLCGALPNITWMVLQRSGFNPSVANYH